MQGKREALPSHARQAPRWPWTRHPLPSSGMRLRYREGARKYVAAGKWTYFFVLPNRPAARGAPSA